MIDDLKKRYDSDLESMHAKMKLVERDLEDCRKGIKVYEELAVNIDLNLSTVIGLMRYLDTRS